MTSVRFRPQNNAPGEAAPGANAPGAWIIWSNILSQICSRSIKQICSRNIFKMHNVPGACSNQKMLLEHIELRILTQIIYTPGECSRDNVPGASAPRVQFWTKITQKPWDFRLTDSKDWHYARHKTNCLVSPDIWSFTPCLTPPGTMEALWEGHIWLRTLSLRLWEGQDTESIEEALVDLQMLMFALALIIWVSK